MIEESEILFEICIFFKGRMDLSSLFSPHYLNVMPFRRQEMTRRLLRGGKCVREKKRGHGQSCLRLPVNHCLLSANADDTAMEASGLIWVSLPGQTSHGLRSHTLFVQWSITLEQFVAQSEFNLTCRKIQSYCSTSGHSL